MKITVRGQTIETFKILVEDETNRKEYDIAAMLVVNDATTSDLDAETRNAAAHEHFWNQVAIEAEMALEDFERTFYATYQAHIERFARYFLKAQGEKTPTGAAKEKAAILLYSENADKEAGAKMAYKSYEEEMKKIGLSYLAYEGFLEEMYQYTQTLEEIERIRLAMEHKAKQLKAVSAAFNTKSWSIKTMAADKRALMNLH